MARKSTHCFIITHINSSRSNSSSIGNNNNENGNNNSQCTSRNHILIPKNMKSINSYCFRYKFKFSFHAFNTEYENQFLVEQQITSDGTQQQMNKHVDVKALIQYMHFIYVRTEEACVIRVLLKMSKCKFCMGYTYTSFYVQSKDIQENFKIIK